MVPIQRSSRQIQRAARHWRCARCRGSSANEPLAPPPRRPLASSSPGRRFVSSTSSLPAPPPASAPPSSSGSDDPSPDEILSSFANLDHRRASRAGFPEAVFGQGKTPTQIHSILDSMARNVNGLVEAAATAAAADAGSDGHISAASTAIIATRIDRDVYDAVAEIGPLRHGAMEYHDTARIISVRARALTKTDIEDDDDATATTTTETVTAPRRQSVVVACAGTTDLPVAEEAAVTLVLSGVPVTRVYDCGVAGLHRIISALPKLRDPDVGCVIVCAGMDGALPSVVGGLVDVPVVAVPTSVGYGMSLGGASAMLTMLNSCSPGVGVVNIDNGFGGAVWAMKCLNSRQK